ncbi:acyl-CoA desaturase, partial [Streptomyces anulatus]|nr:acyl-CoA desaturase [Streptomyces anulatus]
MTTSSDVIPDGPQPTDSAEAPSATLGGEQKRSIEQITLLLFITVPFLALVAAVPLAW